MIHFDDVEKIKAFDRISECFLKQNFGSVSKGDLELIFFSILLEHCRKNNMKYDDYTLGNILGITQQRVRNLKIKNQLRYPDNTYDWQAELAQLAQNVRYSEDDRFALISLDNPILMIEIQYFIEQKGGFVDYSFNPKLLKMPVRDFAVLMVEIGMEKNENAILKKIQMIHQQDQSRIETITKANWKKRIKEGSIEFAKLIITNAIETAISSAMSRVNFI